MNSTGGGQLKLAEMDRKEYCHKADPGAGSKTSTRRIGAGGGGPLQSGNVVERGELRQRNFHLKPWGLAGRIT